MDNLQTPRLNLRPINGFDTLQFDRMAASADAPNLAAVRVMQKLGMSWVRRSTVNGSELVHYSIAQEKSR